MTRADYKKYLADPDEMDELTTLFYKPIQVDICHRCERAWLAIRANVSDDGVYKAFQRFATSKAKLELVAA
jgi:hypothetical protein